MHFLNLHNVLTAVVAATIVVGITERCWAAWEAWIEYIERCKSKKRLAALVRQRISRREMTADEKLAAARTHERLLAAGWRYDGFCGLYFKPVEGRIHHG